MVRISLTRRTMLRFSWADTGLLMFSWPRVTVSLPGSAAGQRHDQRLPELLGCLHQAADNDRGE